MELSCFTCRNNLRIPLRFYQQYNSAEAGGGALDGATVAATQAAGEPPP